MIEVRLPNRSETFYQVQDLWSGAIFEWRKGIYVFLGEQDDTVSVNGWLVNCINLKSGLWNFIRSDEVVELIEMNFYDDEQEAEGEEDERKDL